MRTDCMPRAADVGGAGRKVRLENVRESAAWRRSPCYPRKDNGGRVSRASTRFSGFLFALCACIATGAALAATFVVNSTGDADDANPGDGICEVAVGTHVCTLRAAIDEANALAGADTIQLQPNVTYVLHTTSVSGLIAADLLISDSVTISGAGLGGAIIDGNGPLTLQRVFFIYQCIGNATNVGGSCTNGGVIVNMTGVTIENGYLGGISNDGTLTLDNCVVKANEGGGLTNQGTLTLTNSIVSDNHALSPGGGGIYDFGSASSGDMFITNSTISGNTTSGYGGGLMLNLLLPAYTTPTIRIANSTISGNSASEGGGIYNSGASFVLINDTISGNSSTGDGGGLYNTGDNGLYNVSGTMGLYNVTVTQNQANSDASGTGIGGGVYNALGTFYFTNSIIAKNTLVIPGTPFPTLAVDDCAGTLTLDAFNGFNIMSDVDTSHCLLTGPVLLADPYLGPLQLNGGPTMTHAISPGSPAIDAGNPAGCMDDLGSPITTDQRGVHRPYGTYCDIGAFEYADIIFQDGFNH